MPQRLIAKGMGFRSTPATTLFVRDGKQQFVGTQGKASDLSASNLSMELKPLTKLKPMHRLKDCWLESAGLKAGTPVSATHTTSGDMEIHLFLPTS